jgi:hypothetical protein
MLCSTVSVLCFLVDGSLVSLAYRVRRGLWSGLLTVFILLGLTKVGGAFLCMTDLEILYMKPSACSTRHSTMDPPGVFCPHTCHSMAIGMLVAWGASVSRCICSELQCMCNDGR